MTRDDSNRTRQTQGSEHAGKDDDKKDMSSWKPGSDAASAGKVGSAGDFGVPVGAGPSLERDYVSNNTKRSDPGNAMPRSGEEEGLRTTGAGAPAAGDGSGSGGDLDPDVIGVGTGTGVSMGGPDSTIGADETDGSSAEMASGGPAQGRNQTGVHHIGGSKRIRGTVVTDPDFGQAPQGQGADAVTNPARGDDSFAAEISLGEAAGDDQPLPPGDTDGESNRDDV